MSGSEVKISLRVQSGTTRNELTGCVDGVWRVKVAVPPVRGRANQKLIAFLSETLCVSKRALDISAGHTSRNKVVSVHGISEEEVTKRLSVRSASSSL